MARRGTEAAALVPINEVARRFGLRASAIRYYEERGLLKPAAQCAGRRWYGLAEIRQLAIIRYWQTSGLMSLDEIAELLAGPTATRAWRQVLEDRVAALREQIERMEAAKGFLEHIMAKHDAAPDGCPYHEALIWDRHHGHHYPPYGHD